MRTASANTGSFRSKAPRVIFERDDGTRGDGDISGKARIYRNMQSEKEGPPAQPYWPASPQRSTTSGYTYEEVTPLVAEIIEKHSIKYRDWITHQMLVRALSEWRTDQFSDHSRGLPVALGGA